jgi:homoprotocatechuate degradation regulator HpaR
MSRPEAALETAPRSMRGLERSLPMQLLQAREAAMARFRPMLREHGLTEQQWRVVRVLAACPAIDATELARRSVLLAPSLTRILQYLESAGLIKRSADATDQRRAVFALTARGRRLFDAVAPDSERIYADIAQAFGARRLADLYRLLAEFCSVLDADVSDGAPASHSDLGE